MSEEPTATTGSANAEALACRLRRSLPAIVRQWEERVAAEGTAHRALKAADVCLLLESMARGGPGPGPEPSADPGDAQPARLERVLREYRLLRNALLDVLEAEVPLPTGDRDALLDLLSDAEQEAAARFAMAHRQALARGEDEQRRMARAVRDREHTLRLTTDAVPVLLSYIDTQGCYRFANRTYEEWIGLSREVVVGRHIRDVVGAERYENVRPYIERALSGEAVAIETAFPYPDGKTRYIHATYTPDVSETGEVRGIVVSVSDLTGRRQAEEKRRVTAERVAHLQAVTAALSEALTPDQVAAVVVSQGINALGARAGVVGVVENDDVFHVLNYAGYIPGNVDPWLRFPVSGPYPISEAVRAREPLWLDDRDEYIARVPAMASAITHETQSFAAIPFMIDGRVTGALAMSFASRQTFGREDRDFMLALARQCGQALERARLYEAEVRAVTVSEEARRRSAFLAEASAVLASSLDYETTLSNVARIVVPGLADWCTVHLLEEDGSVSELAIAHADPAKVEWAREFRKRYPPDPSQSRGIWQVLRTGQSTVYREISDDLLVRGARDPEHLRLMRELGMRSVMMIPLVARGGTLGAISFIRAESGNLYGDAEQAAAEELARRCALAVENARLFQDAQKMNRAKDEFLAMLAHELRNPLGAISNALHLLNECGADNDPMARHRAVATRQVRHMAHLLEDLLDVSRITRGKVLLRMEPVDLARVVEDAAVAVRAWMDERGHSLSVSLPRREFCVAGDPTRLEQIIANLLNNAAKYTERGGAVKIRLAREGADAVLTVSDNGAGICRELLPHVFELFTQADRSLDRSEGGLGIGLTLVKSLVEMHGGTVRADSAGLGHGSRFTVRLPILEAAGMPRGQSAPPPVAGARSVCVLLVDDNADAADTLTEIMTAWGHIVGTASDGPEALRAAADQPPDVVLLDIGLPGMDGFEVARRLRALPEAKGAFLAALTGYSGPEDRRETQSAGFDAHLPKPVDLDALRDLLAQAARRGENS
jgi:PAS domain S-box-containing protein